jgi:Fe-S-cluster containining protein
VKVACRKGCHWCCYIPVYCRADEAKRAWDACDQDQVRSRLTERSGADFEPCVFLSKRACTIYESRPAACRGFNSTSRSACKRGHKNRRADEPIPVEMQQYNYWRRVRESLPGPDRLMVEWVREAARG